MTRAADTSDRAKPADARQAHTFVFADLAGFTALTEAHGDEHAADLVADFSNHVRGLLAEYGAKDMKTIGDAVMLRCDRAARAIELSLRIVEEIGSMPGFPIVRVGLHTGSAVERDGDWFGATVNIAARVSGVAGGGEVLLTEATRQAAGHLEPVSLNKLGPQRFKNVGDPVVLYQASNAEGDAAAPVVDPVCRMAVDPKRAAGHLVHEGRSYVFCSLTCVAAFASEPGRYADGGESGPTGHLQPNGTAS